MSDLIRRSLDYFLAQPADVEWSDFLAVLGETLAAQMGVAEARSFFAVLGRRMARRHALRNADTLESLEAGINLYHQERGWGFVQVQETADALEIVHACAPLRDAFGDEGMAYAPALLEGLYAEWLGQLGAGTELKFQQAGAAERPVDALRFRLAA